MVQFVTLSVISICSFCFCEIHSCTTSRLFQYFFIFHIKQSQSNFCKERAQPWNFTSNKSLVVGSLIKRTCSSSGGLFYLTRPVVMYSMVRFLFQRPLEEAMKNIAIFLTHLTSVFATFFPPCKVFSSKAPLFSVFC